MEVNWDSLYWQQQPGPHLTPPVKQQTQYKGREKWDTGGWGGFGRAPGFGNKHGSFSGKQLQNRLLKLGEYGIKRFQLSCTCFSYTFSYIISFKQVYIYIYTHTKRLIVPNIHLFAILALSLMFPFPRIKMGMQTCRQWGPSVFNKGPRWTAGRKDRSPSWIVTILSSNWVCCKYKSPASGS